MILIGVVALIVVFAVLAHALDRAATVGDLQMEEPAQWWDDPEWEWPVRVRDARVDRVIREMERTL